MLELGMHPTKQRAALRQTPEPWDRILCCSHFWCSVSGNPWEPVSVSAWVLTTSSG